MALDHHNPVVSLMGTNTLVLLVNICNENAYNKTKLLYRKKGIDPGSPTFTIKHSYVSICNRQYYLGNDTNVETN